MHGTNEHLSHVRVFIVQCTRHCAVLAGQVVLDGVGLAVRVIDGTDQQVVADVVEMTTVLQPRSCSTDVVSGALAASLW